MRRRQWVEIADQPWCPAAVRDGLTDYLQFVIDRTAPYAAAGPLLAAALRLDAPVPDASDAVYEDARGISRRFQDALTAIFVDENSTHLYKLTRVYGVF